MTGSSRRLMLAGGLAAGFSALLARRQSDAATLLLAALSDVPAAARLGRTHGWRKAEGRNALSGRLIASLGLNSRIAARMSAAAIRERLARRVRMDYAAGRTVIADGWMLSVTESRLCALAAHDAGIEA